MLYNKINIRQFKNAWFDNDFSEITEEQFKEVYTEYIDKTGLYASEEFDKVGYIVFLNNRVNSISVFIKLQKDFLKEFGVPCENYFYFIKKFGHTLRWDGEEDRFLGMLEDIENKEKKYKLQIKNEQKLLGDIRKKNNKNVEPNSEKSKIKTRESFIRTLNSLGKIGYLIDEEKTSVEQLALMILQQKEELEDIENKN